MAGISSDYPYSFKCIFHAPWYFWYWTMKPHLNCSER